MYRLVFLLLLAVFPWALQAQSIATQPSRLGLYLSSKGFEYSESLYLEISQFLTLDDDRSAAGRMKSEFIIRLGWMLCEQIQRLSGADTVYFLNADLAMGRAWQGTYQPGQARLSGKPVLDSLDQVLVINPFHLSTRTQRSVYIRSNRMITDRIPVKKVSFQVLAFDPARQQLTTQVDICMDDLRSPKAPAHFDLFEQGSPLGKFLSKSFSQWWEMRLQGQFSNCE